jgi:MtrB/PioB family decaheme-associated outer membrane protein
MMRKFFHIMLAACAALAGSAGAARAQQATPSDLVVGGGSVDFGVRLSSDSGDPARNQRYRDLRDGATVDRLRYARDDKKWVVAAGADHMGYRDQRYFGEVTRPGKVKLSFEWNQIPLFNSAVTQTLYTSPSEGVFRIDDAIQRGMEAGTLKLADVAPGAARFDLRSRRNIGSINLVVTPTRNLDLKLNVKTTQRTGQQQWGVGFGFSNEFEVPAPLDHHSTDLGSVLEWANTTGMVRVGYDGSWFHNNVESIIVDNPLRLTDTTAATSQARMALWPSSHTNTLSTAGSIRLPAHSQATAYISVGNWTQNEPLIPFTINTAISPIPLDRPTAEADARVTAMNYTASSHPTSEVSLTARFKRYDFDNRTPHFAVTNYVRTDQSVATSLLGGNEPLGYVRDNFDADASYTPKAIPFTALRVGYGREEIDRTHRFVETTRENTLRTSIDISGNTYVSLRTGFERSVRTGVGLDEEVLDEIGEQASLRQFDISNRNRNRVSTILQVTPIQTLGFNATIATGNDHRPDAAFGLQQLDNRTYALGADYVPSDGMSFGANYGYESYKSRQMSRQAVPGVQFNDPTRNWFTNGAERVNTANLSADLLKLISKTEIRLAYDVTRSRAHYDYILTADTTLPAVQQLPSLLNELRHGTFDLRYRLRRDLGLGLVYWYDRYEVQDFALGLSALGRIDINTGSLLLGNAYLPYTDNTFMLRLSYFW